MFKREKKTDCETPTYSRFNIAPEPIRPSKPNPNYIPPASVAKAHPKENEGDNNMIDLKEIEKDIDLLQTALNKRKEDYRKAKESNLKEQFGDNFGCGNCAYSCCVCIGDDHIICSKGKCIYCLNYCDEYMPINELSEYIRDKHHYNEYMLNTFNDFFDVLDIMQRPELHQAALSMLKLRDEVES